MSLPLFDTAPPPTDIVLRPYQVDCLEAIKAAVDGGNRRGAINLPTAGGKTIIFSHVPDFLGLAKTDRVLILAHRDELVEQARDKYLRVNPGEMVGIEKASSKAGPMDRMVVASVQTLHKRRREEFFERWGRPRLVITDECHHATAESYRAIYDYLDIKPGGDVIHIGCTATLKRSDRVGLDAVYDKVWYAIGIEELIKQGYLAKLRGFRIETSTDISNVGTTAGDFNQGELAKAVNNERRNAQIVHDTLKLAPTGKIIVFAADVGHSADLAERFTLAGCRAAHVDATTDKDVRRQIVEDFHNNRYRALCNFGIFTEGFDEPSVDTIALARPTKSPLLYAQMIGRGTRIFERKEFCTVIDFVDISKKHTVVTLPSLLGMPPNVNLHGRDAMKVAAMWRSLADESPLVAAQVIDPDVMAELAALPPAQRAAAFMKALIDEARRKKTYIPVNMLRPPEMPDHLRYDYDWVNLGDSYRLTIPAVKPPERTPREPGDFTPREPIPQVHLLVEPGEFGTFVVRYDNEHTRERFVSTVLHHSDQRAIDEAEGLARRHIPERLGAVYRWAKWRREPATPGQKFALQRARIQFPEHITKGEANNILNQVRGE